MAPLAYRFTFIDVTSEEALTGEARRARSGSPLRSTSSSFAGPEMAAQDAAARHQLHRLQQGPEVADAEATPNLGSVGHPTLCKRPCYHMARAKPAPCRKGKACGFCHLPHEKEAKPDKVQRTLIQVMPKADLLNLIAEVLRGRIQQEGLRNAEFLLAVPGLPWSFQVKIPTVHLLQIETKSTGRATTAELW